MVKKLQGKQSEQCMGCEVEIYAIQVAGYSYLSQYMLHDQYHILLTSLIVS